LLSSRECTRKLLAIAITIFFHLDVVTINKVHINTIHTIRHVSGWSSKRGFLREEGGLREEKKHQVE
jgi:hypothetical protein